MDDDKLTSNKIVRGATELKREIEYFFAATHEKNGDFSTRSIFRIEATALTIARIVQRDSATKPVKCVESVARRREYR